MAGGVPPGEPAGSQKEIRSEKKRSKALEKELLRKDRVPAETAALLTLRKKAQAIWGEDEAD